MAKNSALGTKVRVARESKKLSIQQLGDLVGLSDQQIRRIEQGKSEVGAVTLARIAKATNKTLDSFLGDVLTVQEQADQLWKRHKLDQKLPGSREADFKAKKAILESMGLWEMPTIAGKRTF